MKAASKPLSLLSFFVRDLYIIDSWLLVDSRLLLVSSMICVSRRIFGLISVRVGLKPGLIGLDGLYGVLSPLPVAFFSCKVNRLKAISFSILWPDL